MNDRDETNLEDAIAYDGLSQSTKNRRNNMSQTSTEVLTVEAVNQYGFKSNGKNYSISTRLAQSGITPQHFQVGSRIQAEIWTGPQGGKKINSFQPVNGTPVASAPVAYQAPVAAYMPPVQPPMPPALPQTNVASTPAPGGVPPVAKTRATPAAVTTEDKMSKADWAARNNEIAIQAIVKSSLESPALGEHVTGKSTPEFMQLTRDYVKFNLETYRMAVEGTL